MARRSVTPPSELETWFTVAGVAEKNLTLPFNPVSIIRRSTAELEYYPRAEDAPWPDVYAYAFGDWT